MKAAVDRVMPWAAPALLFAAGAGAGLALWERLRLPFRNPWDVHSALTRLGFHPANNELRFLVLVALPLLLMLVTFLALPARWRARCFRPEAAAEGGRGSRPGVLGPGLFMVFVLFTALHTPTYNSWQGLDTFHEGESLGAATCVLHGQIPYRDTLFVHGLFQDPLRALLAFQLFGRSIGAVRGLESIIKVLAFAALGACLLRLCRGQAARALAVFLALFAPFTHGANLSVIIPSRDITTYAFFLLMLCLHAAWQRESARRAEFYLLSAAVSLVAVGSFAYSIDRGFYLTATWAALVALLLLAGRGPATRRAAFGASALAGAGLGAMILLVLLHGHVRPFVDYVFLKMLRYKELMDGFVFPVRRWPFLVAVLLAAGNVSWLGWIFLGVRFRCRGWGEAAARLLQRHLPELALGFVALTFFRSALGRADAEHLRYSLAPTVLLAAFLLTRALWAAVAAVPFARRLVSAVPVGMALVFAVGMAADARHTGLWQSNFPFRVPDARLVYDEYRATADFIRAELAPGETFYVLTNEAIWYYLVDQPCPTRFPVVWLAAPRFYQEEVVASLERQQVKLIIYNCVGGWNEMDGVGIGERQPVLMDYVHRAYAPYATVAGSEIWRRTGAPVSGPFLSARSR